MNARSLLSALVLAVVAAGCIRALSPSTQDRVASRAGAAGETNATSPAPPLPSPPEADGPATLVPGPRVIITSPSPNHLLAPTLPPTSTIHWAAGAGPAPKQYRYRLFTKDDPEFDFLTLLVRPDSVIRFYAPSFTGWTQADGSTNQVTLTDLPPNLSYVFVVLAFDNRGNFDRVLTFDTNMLYFNVSEFALPAGVSTAGPGGGDEAGLDPTPRPRGH